MGMAKSLHWTIRPAPTMPSVPEVPGGSDVVEHPAVAHCVTSLGGRIQLATIF